MDGALGGRAARPRRLRGRDQVIDADTVARIRARYDRCFGCGSANPIGLHLDGFERTGNQVTVAFRPQPDHVGFSDVLHGGIIAAVLDEVMAWTAMLVEGVLVVTGTLELRYRQPAAANTTFDLVGTLEQRRGRRLMIQGKLCDGDTVVAEGSGVFLAIGDMTG
jgi:acyl-coenzyme A thioesterase PaaI-like protein